ncbi:MAG: hypothetical protein KKC75_06710 [Nanoarchaeota archaeon]|nr:hypothetical protein [Nanoarchaeota archaeon]MBU1005574.1 hypothetical protein [Nanoarchaeota archaeon]MBU1945960.1 hypothetical protein [Nanoarchaeota archaeon]
MSKQGEERYHLKVKGVIKKIKIKKGLNEEKVRIISNLLFDGAVYVNNYHYSIMYVNSSKELINQFMVDMGKAYNVNPSSFEDCRTYYRVKYLSKQIYADLMKYFKSFSTSDKMCFIPSIILNNNKFKTIILRAFWENEGSISKDGKLSADLMNLKIIKQLSRLHNELGIKHSISRYWKNGWAYKLFLSRSKENYKRFLDYNLFLKSIATKGYFIGDKKIDVLKEYFDRKFD